MSDLKENTLIGTFARTVARTVVDSCVPEAVLAYRLWRDDRLALSAPLSSHCDQKNIFR